MKETLLLFIIHFLMIANECMHDIAFKMNSHYPFKTVRQINVEPLANSLAFKSNSMHQMASFNIDTVINFTNLTIEKSAQIVREFKHNAYNTMNE